MKIKALHIENFGCFSNSDYRFDGQLNSIMEDNGYGKSTLASFIAIMFYGFFDEKGRAKSDGLRAYYKPWQGGNFGGTMDFTYQGTDYRISRQFGKKPADDVLNVYRLDTLLKTDELTDQPGVFVFQVDGESFLRTVFIRDNDCRVELTDGVHAKIGNLGGDTMDMNRFQAADAKLKDEINGLNPRVKTGRVNRLRAEIGEMNQKLLAKAGVENAVNGYRETITALRETRKEKETTLDEIRKKQEALSKYQSNLRQRTEYEGLQKETEARKAAFEEA